MGILLLLRLPTLAQDHIIRKDGQQIKARILSTDQTYIRYKRFDNLTGPDYFIYKTEVDRIEYEKKAPVPEITGDVATLEKQAARYQKNGLLYSLLGGGAILAGAGTFLVVQNSYNSYRDQLLTTNATFTDWHQTNYGRAPSADDLVQPKNLLTFGSPGIYAAGAGLVGGVVLGLIGQHNAKLARETRRTIAQKRQFSMSPYHQAGSRLTGVHLTLTF
ncbi:hypothetical protein GCM10023189_10420 [Nibrella saemangeumensis]|uniref:DUF5683 domain-containing protein n=1 Tax=Nibrella saemangeumensis TaxID=1084526 RepID=A0ABP8MJP9_9BACT